VQGTSTSQTRENRATQAARMGAAQLSQAFDVAPLGMGLFLPDGRFTMVNEQLCRILGYSRDELLRQTFQEISFPEDLPHCLELTQQVLLGKIPRYQTEKRFVRPDGSHVWVRVTVSAVTGPREETKFLVGIIEDITAERAAEENRTDAERRLRTSEEQFRSLANSVPQLGWIATADGRRSWFNDRWYAYTGLSEAESRDYGWHKVIHPDDLDRVRAGQAEAFRQGAIWEDTVRLRRTDGVFGWFLSRAMPVSDTDGGVVHWIGTNTDVTERLEAHQKVQRNEARLRRIVESGIVGVFDFRVNRQITGANAAFLAMLGISQDDVRAGRVNSRDLTPERWHEIDDAKFAEVVRTGVALQWEKEFLHADGSAVPVLVAKALLEGSTDEGIAICLDMSDRKAAERERERLLRLERDARIQAERATKLRDDVLAVVAHDLRNPVHTTSMAASLIAELPLGEADRKKQVAIIQRSANSMDRLINDLLDVSKIEAGTLAVAPKPISAATVVRETIDAFAPLASERRIAFKYEAARELPVIAADHDRLMQVLSNLVGNAFKFTPAGGRVLLRVAALKDHVRFTVEDSGPGIAAADLERIFDRFWQKQRATRSGAGLGLAISKAIVEAHDGSIWVESTEGRGSAFHFTVPIFALPPTEAADKV
jgi:PAS domain S-box-containing protein